MAESTQLDIEAHGRGRVDSGGQPVVRFENVVKRFRRGDGSTVNAIDGVSFDVHPGEFVVLLGPSGCGKTTLLRTLAGLERADSGRITIRERVVFDSAAKLDLPPERRRLSMIFQSYALWPHMTTFDNIAYPLRSRKTDKLSRDEVRERVDRVCALVGISEIRGQFPGQMSGGQQQRVALARSLVGGDDLVLFDEPLSNVDAKVRESLRRELLEMQRELGFAAVYVTHDQNEAMELAHRVAVMGEGKVQQLGQPHEVYLRPTSRYVANFVGTSNEFTGTVTSIEGDHVVVDSPIGTLRGVSSDTDLTPGTEIVASFRPEHGNVSVTRPDTNANTWECDITRLLFLGSQTEQVLDVKGMRVRTVALGIVAHRTGDSGWLSVAPEAMRILRV